MIFKRRLSSALLVLLCGAFAVSETTSDDFKFDSDDLQIVYSDPPEAVMKPPSRYIYAKELAQCPAGESKMMLTLLLQSVRWSDVSERKKEKAIKKLSRFFLVPRQFITVSDIHTPEILEMLKHSINKSNSLLNAKESVARMEFMIGCGDKLFENGRQIARQINEYVKSGVLDELSGLPFNWWNIWAKNIKSRVQRTRRQATDGSGNEEDDEYYDEDDYNNQGGTDEEEEEDIPPPDRSTQKPHTVRHNQRKKTSNKKVPKEIYVKQIQDEPSVKSDEISPDEIPQAPLETPLVEIEAITQRNVPVEGPITPIDVSENIKLETFVNKTIVNDNNVVDVPDYREKDKLLEEVRKIISEPPADFTTVLLNIVETTTHHITETTPESPMTTTEEITVPTTILITTTPAPETETIFVPINPYNNENINMYDEKLSIVTTADSTTLPDEDVTERVSTQVHETTHISLTTLPTTTEILTTSTTEPSTTTHRIVDATLAVDKISTSNDIDEKTEATHSTPKNEHKKPDVSESNYDDEYDDILPDEEVKKVDDNLAQHTTQASTTTQRTTPRTTTLEVTTPAPVASTTEAEEETSQSTPSSTTVQTTIDMTSEAPSLSVSSEAPIDSLDYEDTNIPPRVEKRIPKSVATSGKPFSIKIDETVFYDEEDKTNLQLQLLDKNGQPIREPSWVRFDPAKREVYGLPLESDVSYHEFKLRATDSSGEFIDENLDITVQQHKGLRSVNHEIFIQVNLEKNYESPVDWEIRLIRGIVEALDDDSLGSVVVREVRQNKYENNMFTFIYTNESLPKDHCPKEELDLLMTRLTKPALNEAMKREITVRNVEKELVGTCQERTPPKIQPTNTKNYPPTVKNPVDKVEAFVGQLLVYEVPKDTFYDPEDFTELKLTLLNEDRTKLEPNNWLQFDSKNREFYGVPGLNDKNQQYILMAEDKDGFSTNDALVVEVKHGNFRRDHSATFTYQLDIGFEQFQQAATKRKFIEGVARVFQDADTKHIVLKGVNKLQYAGRTSVVLQNATLNQANRGDCPSNEIEKLRSILLRQDRSVRDEVKETIGTDFNVLKITVAPTGKCAGGDTARHPEDATPPPEDGESPIINQDVLMTYVLPTGIILLMLLIALLIACLLYKRRNTGKMELGDEEERKSFRSKGIPVIFQDELEEKPEIVTKSPIIMKDEKPPLLPQYNGMSQDGDDDNMDQYIPPQPLLMGSRESRGKSPVTPSYRKPPPYVSP